MSLTSINFISDDENDFHSVSSSDDSFHSTFTSLNSLLDSTFSNFPNNFNVVHINAQSIPSHYSDLLDSFDNNDIHAILVSETFLKPCLPSTSFSLPNFHLIRNDRTGKGGGGVAIYLRSHIPFTILNLSPSQYSESSEHIFIEVMFGRLKLLLGVFYSPSIHIDYFLKFENLLEQYVSTVDHSIILGDFNTCLIKNDSRAKRLRNIINSANLNILPMNATHFFPNCNPSQLDLAFVSSPDHVAAYGQHSAEAFSYHDLIYVSYKIRPPKVKPTVVMRRSFKKFDNNRFWSDVNKIDWNLIFSAATVDDKLTLFNSFLTELFDRHAPLRPIKLKHLPAPWLTKDIRVLMTKRNRAKSKFKRNPSAENLLKYKYLRNRCNKICRDAQRNYIHSSIANQSSSGVWRFLETLGIGSQRIPLPQNLDFNALNKYFTSTSSMNNQDKQMTLSYLNSLTPLNSSPFIFKEITSDIVKDHIYAVRSDATGCDGLNRKMILLLLDTVAPVLTHIFNFSLFSHKFPSIWKNAYVIPIPKNKNPSTFSHYRPISILPFLSKILERIVHHQLNNFLYDNHILNPFQSGFRRGHSTVTALVKVCDDIRLNTDNQLLTIVTLLDFSNAFNSVDYDILLAVLQSQNISSEVIEWFHSYLNGRQQCVRCDGKISSLSSLTAGVPQGGVLSPLLFSLFINSVSHLLSSHFHLYADDLQLYTAAPAYNISEAIAKMNDDLSRINSWSQSYGLLVNPSKSQVIIIGSPYQLAKVDTNNLPSIRFGTANLVLCTCVKNLGLLVDNTLSWVPQVADVSRKIFATVRSLNRWKNFLPIKTKITLANSLLLPILDYADICYPDLTEEQLNKLERLQNLCIRFIFGLRKFDHVSHYRVKLKWLPIRQRRDLHLLSFLYTILSNNLSPSYLKERFCYLGSDCDLHMNLRSGDDNRLKLPTSNSKAYNNSFTIKSVRLWNKLPADIRHSQSLAIFKNVLKKYYLSINP